MFGKEYIEWLEESRAGAWITDAHLANWREIMLAARLPCPYFLTDEAELHAAVSGYVH